MTRARWFRLRLNWFPAYRGTGGRLTYVSEDFGEVRVRLPLNRRTRNLYGTTFGGSMYGAIDPIYTLMLHFGLGSGFVVWDKAAAIRFRRPGRSTLYATFVVDEAEREEIRRLTRDGPVDRVYEVELVDADGVVHAACTKTVYVRRAT